MRLASYEIGGRSSYGVLADDGGIIDLSRHLEQKSLLALIESGSFDSARSLLNKKSDYSLDDIKFQIPVQGGEKILCVGINYPEREEEYKGQLPRGEYPNLFARFASSFSAHGEAIVRPRVSDQYDYEGEVALVVGREGRHIPAREALQHICAVTAANEGTVRDWVRHGSKNVTQGKNFDHSGSMGPWLVTSDEIDPARDLTLTTRVNGELRQNDSTKNMFWNFSELIEYISTFTHLLPGDIILTGTPTGAGAHQDPPVYLRPGDTLEVEVNGILTLRNVVADEV